MKIKLKLDDAGMVLGAYGEEVEIDGATVLVEQSVWDEVCWYHEQWYSESKGLYVKQDVLDKVEESRMVAEAKRYLSETDWYLARKSETGEEVPNDVISKRAVAREYIRSIEI